MPTARRSLDEVLASTTLAATVRVGVLVDIAGGAPWVEVPGRSGRVRARSTVPLDPALRTLRREVVLLFEDDDPGRPIVVGLLQPELATPALDAVLADRGGPHEEETLPEVAEVDGRRVIIDGRDEVVLRCGEASITLRRDGKVVVRGLSVETHAAGTNRIKGATVKIN